MRKVILFLLTAGCSSAIAASPDYREDLKHEIVLLKSKLDTGVTALQMGEAISSIAADKELAGTSLSEVQKKAIDDLVDTARASIGVWQRRSVERSTFMACMAGINLAPPIGGKDCHPKYDAVLAVMRLPASTQEEWDKLGRINQESFWIPMFGQFAIISTRQKIAPALQVLDAPPQKSAGAKSR